MFITPATGARNKWIPRAHWSAKLALSMSSRLDKNPGSKDQIETESKSANSGLQSPHRTSTHVHTHICISHTYMHTHTHTTYLYNIPSSK